MDSKLNKIREENTKLEQDTPFNFCDRWCERCPEATRDRCKIYQEEMDEKLQYVADGKDPDDWEAVVKMIKKSFEKTKIYLENIANKEGIDLVELDDEAIKEEKKNEEALYQHVLFKQSKQYAISVSQFIKSSFLDKEETVSDLTMDYETLIWYHTLMPPKIHRLLSGLLVREPVEGLDEDDDIRLYDVVAQIDICLKSVSESKQALQNIMDYNIEDRYEVTELMEILKNIESQLKVYLTQIDEGRF